MAERRTAWSTPADPRADLAASRAQATNRLSSFTREEQISRLRVAWLALRAAARDSIDYHRVVAALHALGVELPDAENTI